MNQSLASVDQMKYQATSRLTNVYHKRVSDVKLHWRRPRDLESTDGSRRVAASDTHRIARASNNREDWRRLLVL